MRITGKYDSKNGVTTVFVNGTIYEIINAENWGTCSIGEKSFFGFILTEELYKTWEQECTKIGTFFLEIEEEETEEE